MAALSASSALCLLCVASPLFADDTAAAGARMQNSTNALAAVTSTNRMDLLDDKYRLMIGDRVGFKIVEDQEDSKSLTVTDSGELEVPYIGRFPAAGRTCRELARAIKIELDKDYYYNATVIMAVDSLTPSRGKVYLVGPVHTPGSQDITGAETLTLSKAILRAGGFTDYADSKNVRVNRKGSGPQPKDQTFTVDVGKILEQGKTDTDLELEPGDVVYVSERLIRF